jgi:hypothetical protein
MKFTKYMLVIIGVVIVFFSWALSGSIGKKIGRALFDIETGTKKNTQSALQQGLEKISQDLNKDLPKMLNEYLRMDEVQTNTSELTVTHYATYAQHSLLDTDFSFLNKNLPKLVNQLCQSKNAYWAMSLGVKYVYIYRDKDGKLIGNPFIIRVSDCK